MSAKISLWLLVLPKIGNRISTPPTKPRGWLLFEEFLSAPASKYEVKLGTRVPGRASGLEQKPAGFARGARLSPVGTDFARGSSQGRWARRSHGSDGGGHVSCERLSATVGELASVWTGKSVWEGGHRGICHGNVSECLTSQMAFGTWMNVLVSGWKVRSEVEASESGSWLGGCDLGDMSVRNWLNGMNRSTLRILNDGPRQGEWIPVMQEDGS